MVVWVLIGDGPFLAQPTLDIYKTFDEACYDCAWLSVAALRRGCVWTVVEAEVGAGDPDRSARRWPSGPWERNRDT